MELTLRQQILAKYGNHCRCCHFNHPAALQIDHVYGGGSLEVKTIGRYTFLKKVLDDTKHEYQLLCANCNCIKRVLNQERGYKQSKEEIEKILPKTAVLWNAESYNKLPEFFTTQNLRWMIDGNCKTTNDILKKWVALELIIKESRGHWRKLQIESSYIESISLVSL